MVLVAAAVPNTDVHKDGFSVPADSEQLEAYLDLVDKYASQCERISNFMNSGFIDLAQSKYTMGAGKISKYQYDRRMQASVRVLAGLDSRLVQLAASNAVYRAWAFPNRLIARRTELSSQIGLHHRS